MTEAAAADAALPPITAGLAPMPLPSRQASPEAIIGLSETELSQRYGRPSWTRQERPAAVWQYETAACTLDVYLYDETGGPRVVHVEARDRNAAPLPLGPCLEQLHAQRRAAAS